MPLQNAFANLATEPKQDAANTSLAAINTNTQELVEALESLRMSIVSLTRSSALQTVDTSGRLRILLDSITTSLTLSAITTVTTVSTVSTLTNQAQVGSYSANDQIPSLMSIMAQGARRNISVT